MRIYRIQIQNFRNYKHFDVKLGEQAVILGENKVGKSNLLYALRLVLDPTLPDSARQLQKSDFWDGLGENFTKEHIIKISIDLTDFDDNDDLMAVLAEHLVSPEPLISRLTFLFQPKISLHGLPQSDMDYEFSTYGGDRPDNRIGYDIRSRIPLEMLPALRDAERDLATWSNSPLKPLLDEASKNLDKAQLQNVANEVSKVQEKVLDTPTTNIDSNVETDNSDPNSKKPLRGLSIRIVSRLRKLAGNSQALDTVLGFSPTDADRLIRAIRLFIDGGKRNVADASLGSANLLYLTLKSLNLEQLADQGSREHTFLAIEEPEAHLHPHLQRLVYRDFLHRRLHQEGNAESQEATRRRQTLLLTTHSPHIVSVAPLRSIVLLKRSGDTLHTVGVSTVDIEMSSDEVEDIERYLDVNRGEILFAKAVLLVEGDAEEYLVPVFAKLLGYDFDELGISVCSVSGVNFLPYVKLLSQKGVGIPFAVITDLDPQAGGKNLGHNRVLNILHKIVDDPKFAQQSKSKQLAKSEEYGIFLNQHTFEIDLFNSGAYRCMCETLSVLTSNGKAKKRALEWSKAPTTINKSRFLKDIEAIGKGRFAQRLASHIKDTQCPEYIRKAIQYVANRSQ